MFWGHSRYRAVRRLFSEETPFEKWAQEDVQEPAKGGAGEEQRRRAGSRKPRRIQRARDQPAKFRWRPEHAPGFGLSAVLETCVRAVSGAWHVEPVFLPSVKALWDS